MQRVREALGSASYQLTRRLFMDQIFGSFQAAFAVFISCANEGPEQRMRLHRLGFELGMELAAQEPGMIGDFTDFDVGAVGSFTGDAQARGLERVLVFAVELKAVAMPFADLT